MKLQYSMLKYLNAEIGIFQYIKKNIHTYF